jgi:hypothetical protein
MQAGDTRAQERFESGAHSGHAQIDSNSEIKDTVDSKGSY